MKNVLGQTHPFLFYTNEDLERVKVQLHDNPDMLRRYNQMKQRADVHLSKPLLTEEEADSVYSQHGRYYDVAALLEEAAQTYPLISYITRDKAYENHVKELLLYYAGFRVWTGPANGDRRTPWHSELATTRILAAFCVLYDVYYDSFSPEERTLIETAMIEKGINPLYDDWLDPSRRVHALDSMGHNWWSVCISYCGMGIITLWNKLPKAEEMLCRVIEALGGFCDYQGHCLLNKTPNFDGQGMYYESASYFSYGIGELLQFVFLYNRAFEESEAVRFPVMEKVGDAIIDMTYLTGKPEKPVLLMNFGDSPMDGSGIAMLCKMLLLCGYGDSRHRFCYDKSVEGDTVIDLVYYSLLHTKTKPSCFEVGGATKLYPDTGYCFWRSSWQPDATLLAVRCGFTWGHAHDDAGSFMLWDKGVPLLIDSGSTSYSSPYYRSYFSAAKAHNVVTVNGRGQYEENIHRGSKFRGTMPQHYETDWIQYLLCDATGPLADQTVRNYRNFLKLGEDLFIIIDDLYACQPSSFQWLLHYNGTAGQTEQTIEIQGEASAVTVYPLSPACTVRTEQAPVGGAMGSVEPEEGGTKPYLCLETKDKTRDVCFINVLALQSDRPVTAEPLQGDGYYGCMMRRENEQFRIFYNQQADGRKMHENSNNRLGEYDTDAYLLVERISPAGRQLFGVYGSYVRLGEEVLYDSFGKDFFVIE